MTQPHPRNAWGGPATEGYVTAPIAGDRIRIVPGAYLHSPTPICSKLKANEKHPRTDFSLSLREDSMPTLPSVLLNNEAMEN